MIESFSRNVLFFGTKDLSRAAFYSVLRKLVTMKTFTFPRGIGELNEKMASRVPIELNVQVRSVRRTEDGVVVTALREGKEVAYQARKAVVAVPGDRVLGILQDPSPDETAFFSGIRYASTVQILCEGKTDLFREANMIWTLPNDDSNFTALGSRGRGSFIAALRESAFQRLRAAGHLDPSHLQGLIQKEFSGISGLRIVRVQIWESATPKAYPGYIKSVAAFLEGFDKGNNVYFCGDYLENPSTEGALTSSIKLLQRIA